MVGAAVQIIQTVAVVQCLNTVVRIVAHNFDVRRLVVAVFGGKPVNIGQVQGLSVAGIGTHLDGHRHGLAVGADLIAHT